MVSKTIKYLILLLLVFNSLSSGQGISVRAYVDSTNYLVGDYVHFKIKVTSDENINVFRPVVKDSLQGAELIRSEPVSMEDKKDKKIRLYEYIISKYDSGDVIIPPVPVMYSSKNDTVTQTIFTRPVFFTVHTVKIDAQADIKDVKSPIKIPMDWKTILLYVLIGLIIIAAIIYAVLYYRRKKAAQKGIVKIIRREPHEEALDSLRNLDSKKLWQKGYIKQYHTEITAVIRRYFEERFGIPALEITTNELLDKMSENETADSVKDLASAFLYNADMVKFAKFIPIDDVNEEMMKQAYEIVEKTIYVPVAEESEADNVQ